MKKQSKTSKKTELTVGQKKLAALGIKLPEFPLTLTGSLPKPTELKELRYKVAKGVQNPVELERKEKLSIGIWIHEQERLHFDVLVDGEMDRSDFISHFASKVKGFSPGGLVRAFGNRYYKRPIITGKLEWQGPITLSTWHYSQRFTNRILKACVTGPYTLMDWSFNEYYPSRTSICEDMTKIIRKEIETLIENGARIIQIDEPAISSRPHEFSLAANALKELTAGLKTYFILHHRHGDLSAIWDKWIRLPVDNFSFEITNPGLPVLPLFKKSPTHKDITLGIIEAHSHVVETPAQIQKRLKDALKIIPANQVWLSSDSGLRTRTTEEATQKMAVLSKTILKLRS